MTTSVTSIPVSRLLEESPFDLRLTLMTGQAGLSHRISSARIQKPGLALAGFTEHLHEERVQVFGNTEISYLSTLTPGQQRESLRKLFDENLACVVVTKDLEIPPALIDACNDSHLALMKTPLAS